MGMRIAAVTMSAEHGAWWARAMYVVVTIVLYLQIKKKTAPQFDPNDFINI